MTAQTFSDRLLNTANPVLLYFWAPWCLPCRGMKPHLDRLAESYAGQVEVWKVNADEEPELARSLKVFGIPTLILYRDGRVAARKTGAQPAAALEALFSAAGEGGPVSMAGIRPVDRALRALAGLAVAAVGWSAGPAWVVVAVGLVIGFTAVYDRCPLWQALTGWIKK